MNNNTIFDYELPLPDSDLTKKGQSLLGFDERYNRIHRQLTLLLKIDEIKVWSKKYYKNATIPLCDLASEQYPLVVFHGDVGTGKTATAESVANQLVRDSKSEDSILFKLSNRVRGGGKVGEMGTLITEAFSRITESAGKSRRAILIIDEGDSLAAARSQQNSHHEDKVAVNTLIQCIDSLRKHEGRIVTILCTNRLSAVDGALRRRAAIVEEFTRPTEEERMKLFKMDLIGLGLTDTEYKKLAQLTGMNKSSPPWTYSDIRTRLYPAALAQAFSDRALTFDDLIKAVNNLKSTPVFEDA